MYLVGKVLDKVMGLCCFSGGCLGVVYRLNGRMRWLVGNGLEFMFRTKYFFYRLRSGFFYLVGKSRKIGPAGLVFAILPALSLETFGVFSHFLGYFLYPQKSC